MKPLAELKRKRALKAARLLDLVRKEADLPEGEEMDSDGLSEMEQLKTDLAALDGRIQRLEEALAAAGEAAQPIDDGGMEELAADPPVTRNAGQQPAPSGSNVAPQPGSSVFDWTSGYGEHQPRQGKGFKFARYCIGQVIKRTEGRQGAAEYIMRRLNDKEVAKALNTTGVSTGGAVIPQQFSTEIIELLRSATVIRASDPVIIEMPGGNLTIPRLAAGATAGYQGELDDMSASQETFDDLQLNAKKLTALVPVSNDLIRRTPVNMEAVVRDDIVESVARREDLAFILGDGSGNSPIGLLNQAIAPMKLNPVPFAANADNATILTQVNGVLLGMRTALIQNFSRMIRPRWIMSAVTEAFLLGLRDNVGQYVFKDEMMNNGTIWKIPYRTTQQLATNLSAPANGNTTANDGSYIFLVDFADVIIADTFNMAVDASDVASYKDSGGNMVSTFIRDQTAFRLIQEHDFAIRHQASVCVSLLPGWAPPGYTGFSDGAAFYVQALSGDMSAAPSTWGIAAPTGSNNPGNSSAVAPGGTQPGRP